MTAILTFIACHGGPAAHFSEFAQELSRKGYRVEVLATGPALEKLRQLKIDAVECNPSELDLDDSASQQLLAARIANWLQPGQTIVTDVGHPLMAYVQDAVAKQSPQTRRFAYYDNPEPFVPGGYSATAARVMAAAQKTLFANDRLSHETMDSAPPLSQRIGIGYYPVQAAKSLGSAREARHEEVRRAFFQRQHLVDSGQKILVYFGGNNDVYFEKAFPAFLRLLQETNLNHMQYLVLFQQHPGARAKNIDGKLVYGQLILSELPSEEAQILADAALYYQTSMGPQFALAHIPAIQVGHETFPDLLVRSGLAPSAATPDALKRALEGLSLKTEVREEKLLEALGISKHWLDRLEQAMFPKEETLPLG